MFEPGQRVRCVVAQWFEGAAPSTTPAAFGAVYTVVAAEPALHPQLGSITVIELAEAPPRDGRRLMYLAEGFRPLEDAEFERLREACLTSPVQVREPAEVLS